MIVNQPNHNFRCSILKIKMNKLKSKQQVVNLNKLENPIEKLMKAEYRKH